MKRDGPRLPLAGLKRNGHVGSGPSTGRSGMVDANGGGTISEQQPGRTTCPTRASREGGYLQLSTTSRVVRLVPRTRAVREQGMPASSAVAKWV